MQICLLRHGDALPVGAPGVESDHQRPLSDEGRKEIQAVAAALRKLNIHPTRILTSPLIRARETAEIVAQNLGDLPVLPWEELGNGFSPSGLLSRLRELAPEESVVLVGHQPDLGQFAAFLLFGDTDADISLKKGGACFVEFRNHPESGRGSLKWLLTQKQLARTVGGG